MQQHSIAAKYAAWPAARFVRPTALGRERRLGLRPALTYQRAATRVGLARSSHGGLRVSGWQPVSPQRRGVPVSGTLRPAVAFHWTGSAGSGTDRHACLAPASWRG
jgi:hypothetical protein